MANILKSRWGCRGRSSYTFSSSAHDISPVRTLWQPDDREEYASGRRKICNHRHSGSGVGELAPPSLTNITGVAPPIQARGWGATKSGLAELPQLHQRENRLPTPPSTPRSPSPRFRQESRQRSLGYWFAERAWEHVGSVLQNGQQETLWEARKATAQITTLATLGKLDKVVPGHLSSILHLSQRLLAHEQICAYFTQFWHLIRLN